MKKWICLPVVFALALCLLSGCGQENPQSDMPSASEPESSSVSQPLVLQAEEESLQRPCLLNVSGWQALKVEDTAQEPGSAYFTASVDEAFSSGPTALWQAAQWEKMDPPEYGTLEVFQLEGETGNLLSISRLSEEELMAAVKKPDSDYWECWKFSGNQEAYEQLAWECLQRQGH